jgi:hypothetical protein
MVNSAPENYQGERFMATDKGAQHEACMQRFIALANEMKDEGTGVDVVSWALMSAAGVYASYSVAGNDGGLTESGMAKVTDAFRSNLEQLEALKKRQIEARQQQQ